MNSFPSVAQKEEQESHWGVTVRNTTWKLAKARTQRLHLLGLYVKGTKKQATDSLDKVFSPPKNTIQGGKELLCTLMKQKTSSKK